MNKKIKQIRSVLFSVSLFILFSINISGQGFTNGSGNTFSLGSLTFSLSGNWSNSGTFTPGTGTVVFNGSSGNQTISNSSGESFYNITVNKASGDLQLLNNISVSGTVTLTSGDLDLNGNTMNLGTTGTISETPGNTVKGTSGTTTATRTLNAPTSDNVAGMGAEITSAANLGSTTITCGHTVQTGNDNSSILKYFDITPTNNTGLSATLVFHYDDSELNGLTESELQLFKSTDGGSTWTLMGGTVDVNANTVTLTGIDGFSRWTLGASSSPLPVELTTFTAEVNETEVVLKWETETEVNNYGFEIEREAPLNPPKGGKYGEWIKIGFIEGHGNSNSPKEYSFTDENPPVGNIKYRLKQIDNDGQFEYYPNTSGIEVEVKEILPTEYQLFQNYPNPFNPSTTIKYALPFESKVRLIIYNSLGEIIAELVNELQSAGNKEVMWNANNVASGVYIYKIKAVPTDGTKAFTAIKKMILLR